LVPIRNGRLRFEHARQQSGKASGTTAVSVHACGCSGGGGDANGDDINDEI